jgi:formylglycine-generating enzyme required for sulfatase activity
MPVPAGEFLYGGDANGKDLEKKEITYDFWIARYPVTNIQYLRFIDDKGYQNPDLWVGEGKIWLNKAKRTEPRLWNLAGFNAALQPVMGVTWYEAEAYCNWANQRYQQEGILTPAGKLMIPADYRIRLPLEWEWEYAARGSDGRQYPWGNIFNKEFANTDESDINRTSVVSMYPDGASPFGVWDMAGNVWEWQGNKYEKKDSRLIRGGSWFNNPGNARCACRFSALPDDLFFDLNLGFRMILSRSSSSFDPES